MKKTVLIGVVVILALIAGCQMQTRSQESGNDNSQLKQVVTNFAVPKDMPAKEMIQYIDGNLNYTTDAYKVYLTSISDYYKRIDKAVDAFYALYDVDCTKYLTETGCRNFLKSELSELNYPKEKVISIDVVNETGKTAEVSMVTQQEGKDKRTRSYYLKDTETGWKVFDMFDHVSKRSVSSINPTENQRNQNIAIFRLRSTLEKLRFDSAGYEKDGCVENLGKDYLFTKENSDAALECYKKVFIEAKEKQDRSICRTIFPNRYEAMCFGIMFAAGEQNCSSITTKEGYKSDKYGLLTTTDICNFYYSQASTDKFVAVQNCRKIQSPEYMQKCIDMFR